MCTKFDNLFIRSEDTNKNPKRENKGIWDH